jgi:hypothetical protein
MNFSTVQPENLATPQRLNAWPLKAFPGLFATLAPPPRLARLYQAEFVGPRWLRVIAPPSLGLVGLGGWWGKRFFDETTGINIVQHGERYEPRFPIHLSREASSIDRQPSLVVRYAPECPPPWPWVVDELRQIRSTLLLGLTYLQQFPAFPLPFLLHARDNAGEI